MAVATKRTADPATIAQDTVDHVLISWSAQGGLKPLVITRAEGSWLYAGDRRILDFSSGLINVNLGHGHPRVVRAIQEQAERVCYVTFSRSKEIILQELATSFNGDYYRAFRDRTVFKDFSAAYFRHSVVPASWTHQEDPFDLPSTNHLEELIAFLDQNARDSVVVIDSLTDLAISDLVEPKDLVTTVKGLQRAAKGWDGLVYLLLTRGILERRQEQLLMDSTDGCLVFEWRSSPRSSTRQRYMYLEKFTGVLPHLPRDKIARFPTMVSSYNGLVVVYMERIS